MAEQNQCPQCAAILAPNAPKGLCPACLLKQGMNTETQAGSTPFIPPAIEELSAQFPLLEIQGLIGQGGMGAVYKARQPGLDRIVALKILATRETGSGFAERFTREARALARLNHPNIVGVYEYGQVNDLHFFIMEFVDGVNLRQLEQNGKIAPRDALQIIMQVCDALQFAHDEGIVHRDIKPENILVDKKGRVKIADFGIAKILGRSSPDQTLTETRHAVGTPHYMAPEQIESPQEVDHRADIFSLGVVLYEMLTGELPLGRFAPPSRRVQIDVRLDEVVLRTLEKEPERRFQHASDVKTEVQNITSQSFTAPPPPPVPGTPAIPKPAPGPNEIASKIKAPAIGILAAALINLILLLPLVVLLVFRMGYSAHRVPFEIPPGTQYINPPVVMTMAPNWSFLFIILLSVILAIPAFICIIGAWRMMKLRNYGLAVFASILTLIMPPGCIIGLAMGIWALVVLSRKEVRDAFDQKTPHMTPQGTVITPPPSKRKPLWILLVALGLLAIAGILFVPFGLYFFSQRHSSKPPQMVYVNPQDFPELERKIRQSVMDSLRKKGAQFNDLQVQLDGLGQTARINFTGLKGLTNENGTVSGNASGFFTLFQESKDNWTGTMGNQRFNISTLSPVAPAATLPTFQLELNMQPVTNQVEIALNTNWQTLEVTSSPLAYQWYMSGTPSTLGPAIERTLYHHRSLKLHDLMRLSDGAMYRHPDRTIPATLLTNQGSMIYPGTVHSSWGLAGADVKFALAGNEAWTNSTLTSLNEALLKKNNGLTPYPTDQAILHLLPPDQKWPATLAFESGDGHIGLVQIVTIDSSDTHKPIGINIRCKSMPNKKPEPFQVSFHETTRIPRLQFRLVANETSKGLWDPMPLSTQNAITLPVLKEILMDESSVARASQAVSPSGEKEIQIEFTAAGSTQFAQLTRNNIRRQLAIVFDGQLLSAPIIMTEISGRAIIAGKFSDKEIQTIIQALSPKKKP